ncbi:uncharacterized protein [Glycine max]|uniref:uncharacterized protein isoform X4 n=1 Tax=Glycine max TaxID=3847 RepID=UPI0007193089|nr:uncharacterized protein LOC100798298 isoform X4 [Glycine max]|eukprot:XP_014625744.1 uncharacterized protein LOC100798298 isoform X2 [Glycine max]
MAIPNSSSSFAWPIIVSGSTTAKIMVAAKDNISTKTPLIEISLLLSTEMKRRYRNLHANSTVYCDQLLISDTATNFLVAGSISYGKDSARNDGDDGENDGGPFCFQHT